jgi:hypothetical protein
MKNKWLIAAAIIYAMPGIYTFGLLWNRMPDKPGDIRAIGAIYGALAWPLALSAIYQE